MLSFIINHIVTKEISVHFSNGKDNDKAKMFIWFLMGVFH